jgi:hypothetical protein
VVTSLQAPRWAYFGGQLRLFGHGPVGPPPTGVFRLTELSGSGGSNGPPPPAFRLGYDRPDVGPAGGVPYAPTFADGQLTVINGDLTITQSNRIVENVEIRGFVNFSGSPTNVQLRHFRCVGRPSRFVRSSMVDGSGAGSGLIVEDGEITAYANGTDNTRYWLNGLNPGNNHVYRGLNIHDVNDAITMNGNNSQFLGIWTHDLTFRTDDADHPTDLWWDYGSHNDGIQWKGPATGNLIEGCFFDANLSQRSGMIGDPNAPSISNAGVATPGNHGFIAPGEQRYPNAHGILLQAKSGLITNTTLRRNWFAHGTYLIQANASSPWTTGNSFTFVGNRLYIGQTTLYDGTGRATQITATQSIGSYTGLWDDTYYATDDANIPAAWRGHVIQRNSPTSGNSSFNPTLTP